MEAFLGFGSMIGFIVGVILLIVSFMKKKEKKKPLIIMGASFALFLIAMAITPTPEQPVKEPQVANVDKDSNKKDSVKTETPKKEEKPTEKPKEKPVETKPEISKEFKNALIKGQTYADLMYMSERAIFDQLTSEYGEGFPEDAAQYAIENIKTDYNENALKKAKVYQDELAMSRDSIWDQLVSDYGEQFTEEQADYALANLPE